MKLQKDEKAYLLFEVLGVKEYSYMQIQTAKTFISHWEKHNTYKTLMTYLGTFMGNLEKFYDLPLS